MKVAKRTFDAVIVGAGGAGLRAALQLSEAGMKTAIAEFGAEQFPEPFGLSFETVRTCCERQVIDMHADIVTMRWR